MKYQKLFEGSNLYPLDTGLKYPVWISISSGKEKRGPRIKVQIDHEFYSILIPQKDDAFPEWKSKTKWNEVIDSKSLKEIFDWIELNKITLLKHWKNEISSKGLSDNIKKLVKI